jgi:hypothetical protein
LKVRADRAEADLLNMRADMSFRFRNCSGEEHVIFFLKEMRTNLQAQTLMTERTYVRRK